MTIKEYKKNFQLHYKEYIDKEKEKDNFNKSQNIFLYKILKNKKLEGKIPIDSTINKSIEDVFKKDEKKKKILNIIKNKKKPANTSYVMSPEKKREPGESPTFYMGNTKKSSKIKKVIEFSSPNKSYISVNLNNRNPNNKKFGKIQEISEKSNISYKDKDYNTHYRITRYKKKIITGYKANTPLASFRYKKYISSNSSDGKRDKSQKRKLYGAIYKINRKYILNRYNTKFDKTKNLSFDKKISPFLKKKTTTKTNIKEPIYLNTTVNSRKNELNENKDKQDKNIKKFKTINTTKSIEIDNNNSNNFLSSQNNSNTEEKNSETNLSDNLNIPQYSSIRNNKEFNLLKIHCNEQFNIKNISKNKVFQNLKQQKCISFLMKNHIKVIKEKDKDKEKKNNVKVQYTGYILTKKDKGKIEKEIKFDNDLEKIKLIFLDIINNISKEQLKLITNNELVLLKSEINKNLNIIKDLNKEKNEYILNKKEKDSIIDKKELEFKEYQKEYLKLKNNFEIMNSENDKLKEKINLMEQENIKVNKDNTNLNEEYIKLKDEYIKLKDEYTQLNQEYTKLNEEHTKLNLVQSKLNEENTKLNEEQSKLKDEYSKSNEEYRKLKEEYTKLNEEYRKYKNNNELKKDSEIKDLEGKIKIFKEELKRKNNNINNNINHNINLDGAKVKSKRMSLKYNFKFDEMINNLENKKIPPKKKNSLKLSKLIIPEEKKINEDEDKEEKSIEGDYAKTEKTENEENKIEGNSRILENYEKDTLKKNSIIKDENKIEQPIIDKNENVKNNHEEINNNNNINKIEITKNQNNFIHKNPMLLPIPENPDNYMRSKSNDNAIDRKEEKAKRISKAFNRFKKNRPSNYQGEKSNSDIKKSEKINEFAKMLEQKMSGGRSEDKIEVSYDHKAVTDDETDRELNMVELLKSKPISKKKAKPSIKNKF